MFKTKRVFGLFGFKKKKKVSSVLAAKQRTWNGAAVSDCQLSHDALQRVAGPVVIVPAQEPTGEGGRLEALLDPDDRSAGVSVGWVSLDVAQSWCVRRATGRQKSINQ